MTTFERSMAALARAQSTMPTVRRLTFAEIGKLRRGGVIKLRRIDLDMLCTMAVESLEYRSASLDAARDSALEEAAKVSETLARTFDRVRPVLKLDVVMLITLLSSTAATIRSLKTMYRNKVPQD